ERQRGGSYHSAKHQADRLPALVIDCFVGHSWCGTECNSISEATRLRHVARRHESRCPSQQASTEVGESCNGVSLAAASANGSRAVQHSLRCNRRGITRRRGNRYATT